MATRRKTIERNELVSRLNNAMTATYLSDKEKLAIATFAESVLIGGNSYMGYSVSSDEDIANGMGIGVESYKELPIELRKEWEISTRKYF